MVQLAVRPAENRTDTRNCGTEPYQEAIVLTKMTIKTKTFVKNHKGLDLDSHQFDHSRLFHPADATDAEPPGQTPPIISPRKNILEDSFPQSPPYLPPTTLSKTDFLRRDPKYFSYCSRLSKTDQIPDWFSLKNRPLSNWPLKALSVLMGQLWKMNFYN